MTHDQIEKRYQEQMWFLMNVMMQVYPEKYFEKDYNLMTNYYVCFKCMNCKHYDILNFSCSRRKKPISQVDNMKLWHCRWLNTSYSDVLRKYRENDIFMDQIVRDYEEYKDFVEF